MRDSSQRFRHLVAFLCHLMVGFLYIENSYSATCITLLASLPNPGRVTVEAQFQKVPSDEVLKRFNHPHLTELLTLKRGLDGKIVPTFASGKYFDEYLVHGPKFKSVRNLSEEVAHLWEADREFKRVFLFPRSQSGVTITKTSDWLGLPADLRAILESGAVLTTVRGQNLMYAQADYAVYMAVTHVNERDFWGSTIARHSEGRSGILLERVGTDYIPILLRNVRTGEESPIEIKGVGTEDGKFDSKGGLALRGGVTLEEGQAELQQNLRHLQNEPNGVRIAGMITFRSEGLERDQAYMVRIVPGTQRASYRDNSSLEIDPKLDLYLARYIGKRWAEFYLNGLIPATHIENIIVGAKRGQFFMTDFTDIVDIKSFPKNIDGRNHTAQSAMLASSAVLGQIPTYNQEIHFPIFKNAFIKQLKISGKVPEEVLSKLRTSQSLRNFAEIFWNNYLVFHSTP